MASQIQLLASIAFFLILVGLRAENLLKTRVAVVLWSITNVLIFYYLISRVGVTSPYITWAGLQLPLFCSALAAIAVASITVQNGRFVLGRTALVMLIVFATTLFVRVEFILPVINQTETAFARTGYSSIMLTTFLVCVLAPLPVFMGGGSSAFKRLFYVNVASFVEHRRALLNGLLIFLAVFGLTNIMVEGNLANFRVATNLVNLLRGALVTTFFFVLVQHFVFIGLVKYVIDLIFKDEETSMYEIIVFGLLLAGFQYYLPWTWIVREFLYGLVFGYIYLKTRSLTYGIVLRALSLIFT